MAEEQEGQGQHPGEIGGAGEGDQPPTLQRREMMSIPFAPDFPDIYADSVNINLGIYGISLILGRVKGQLTQLQTVPVGVVRMSPELAFVMTQLLRKQLRQFQQDIGPINVPQQVLDALEIEREL